MKLKLPDVTLVCVETREHALARLAVEECMRVAEFGEVLILTDRPLEFSPLTQIITSSKLRFHTVEDWPTKLGWSQSWWFDIPLLLRTKQTLNIQWDSGIWDVNMWRDEWLQYDYIGALWRHHLPTGPRVGNGGFSLVSTRLKRYVYDRRAQFPCDSDVDDALLCIKYRPALEEAGFVWAPEHVADDFSFEGCDHSESSRHFGYHAMFNWPRVFNSEQVTERVELAMRSPTLSKPGNFNMKNFVDKNPDIIRELLGQDKLAVR